MSNSPLYLGATRERHRRMAMARYCMERYHVTLDPVYVDMARINVSVARTYNRHAWRAKGTK